MSRFKYSSDELDMNKVLKMNQDVSRSMLGDQQMSQTRSSANTNIEASLALLRSLSKDKDVSILSADIAPKVDSRLEHRPIIESWEELVAQANLHEPTEVVLEDIMTEAEIQSAFAELDSIEEQFSKKTSIVNKTDLSFLAIATALQVTKSLVFPYIAENLTTEKVLIHQRDWITMINLSRKPIRKRTIISETSAWKNTELDIGLTFFIKRFLMTLQKGLKI